MPSISGTLVPCRVYSLIKGSWAPWVLHDNISLLAMLMADHDVYHMLLILATTPPPLLLLSMAAAAAAATCTALHVYMFQWRSLGMLIAIYSTKRDVCMILRIGDQGSKQLTLRCWQAISCWARSDRTAHSCRNPDPRPPKGSKKWNPPKMNPLLH